MFLTEILRIKRLPLLAMGLALSVQMTQALSATAPSFVTPIQPGEVSLDALVEAVRQATLSSQVPGAIVALNVKVGDKVRAGQALIHIDARAAQQQVVGSSAQLDAAQAAQRVAAKELDRQKQLFEKQYISQGALDRARAQMESAQAQVHAVQAQTQAAQTQTGFFVIQAPFSGMVSEVHVTLGDMAMPGRTLLVMHDPSALRISASLPQTLLGAWNAGSKSVRYEVQGLTAPLQATASQLQLLPTVDASTHTAQLRIALPAPLTIQLSGLAPGMFAKVWVATEHPTNTTKVGQVDVPVQAIVHRAEMTGVYVLDAQGKARLRQVRLGAVRGDKVAVLSGLRAGEQVVADPTSLGPKR